MNELKKDLEETLLKSRPNLSAGSLRTYISLLSNLYKKLDGKDGIDFFHKNLDKIMKHVEDMTSNQSQKTLLSAVFILTGNDEVNKKMRMICAEVNTNYAKSKVAPNREEAFKGYDFIKQKYQQTLDALKANPNKINYLNAIIMSCMTGVLFPPRRLLDWCEMRHKGYDVKTDNCYTKKAFIFNKYKTANSVKRNTGTTTQQIEAPKEVKTLITKYLKIRDNDSDYLLVNPKTNKHFSSATLNKYLYSLFGEKISVDNIRAMYSTDKFKDLPAYNELQKTASQMATSLNSQMLFYGKKTDKQG